MVEVVAAITESQYLSGKTLIEEYAERLGVDLCFQGFAEELVNLRSIYGPPSGCLLLARVQERWVGCVALRAQQGTTCELKRLYVKEEFRGRGVGKLLAQAALVRARELGYAAVVLDTLEDMAEARSLYSSLGFSATEGYYVNPLPGVRYMKLALVGSP